jgi:molecular chaperone GrpE
MFKKKYKNPDAEKPEDPENNASDRKEEDTGTGNDEKSKSDLGVKGVDSEQIEAASEMKEGMEPDEDAGLDEMTGAGSEELITLQKELSESQNKYLRLAAEFDNYRKRTLREKTELIQMAGETLLIDILPVVDDFERGLEQASQAEDMEAVRTGMDLIYNKLKDFLLNHGVKEIIAMNEPFDTDWHEAVTNIPAPSDDMKGKIVDVIQKGYTLYDKVMRYPKVVVGA